MARRKTDRHSERSATITDSLKGFVEAVVERVLVRVRKELPGRDRIRALETHLRRLTKRVEARSRPGSRKVGRPRLNRKCKVAGCGLPHVAHGFCSKHYQSWRRRQRRVKIASVRSRAS